MYDYDYDYVEYETLQDEIAIEMMTEALLEQRQMEEYENYPGDDEDIYWEDDDRYDQWAEVENREMVGIQGYAHWNEEAPIMWWLEEGRFQ